MSCWLEVLEVDSYSLYAFSMQRGLCSFRLLLSRYWQLQLGIVIIILIKRNCMVIFEGFCKNVSYFLSLREGTSIPFYLTLDSDIIRTLLPLKHRKSSLQFAYHKVLPWSSPVVKLIPTTHRCPRGTRRRYSVCIFIWCSWAGQTECIWVLTKVLLESIGTR